MTRLLAGAGLNELGPGEAQSQGRAALDELSPTSVVSPHTLADRDMASACCAALWMRFDYLDKSHHISQSIDTPEGSFWHGIMHRREPDFVNAKYWFRRVGRHEVFAELAELARTLVEEELSLAGRREPQSSRSTAALSHGALAKEIGYLQHADTWDPLRFVDLCQSALDASPPLHTFCRRLQLVEWQVLFDHCFRCASGS